MGKATDAQALGLGLQCGLVWVGLTWTSSLTLSSAKKKTLLEAAERIGSDKTHAPLRAKFYTHLLPHLTMAMLINDDYPLVNLGPNVSDKERDLLERKVQKYASLTDQDCQALHDVLKAQAAGDEMGMLVVHTITELLRRRK